MSASGLGRLVRSMGFELDQKIKFIMHLFYLGAE